LSLLAYEYKLNKTNTKTKSIYPSSYGHSDLPISYCKTRFCF